MEMFEWREKVAETSEVSEKQTLSSEIKKKIHSFQSSFNQSIQDKNESKAMEYATRLKYYDKVSTLF